MSDQAPPQDSESDARRPPWLDATALAILLAVVALAAWRADRLYAGLGAAIATRGQVTSDAAMHRMPRLNGRDYRLVERIRRDYPVGTAVSIPWEHRFARRIMLGFWLSLLPEYPIRSDGELVIRSHKRVGPDDEVLGRGPLFSLTQPKPSTAEPP